ncbi:hypothetical protein OSB04_010585 [Centaurea solstitialis]|uniref:Reverse transcriptase domain-containing protein n=1 Tax=Centaurea solstitialis TaxID=347529 RepID=A0AA38TIM9_9ASTR|nr:hypothetical protein OSB04_010585 [Centaurea solstitialis]
MDTPSVLDGEPRVSVFQRLSPSDDRLRFTEGQCSYAAALGGDSQNSLQFFPPKSKAEVRVALPVEMARQAVKKYNTTMYGYFLGPRVPFLVVKQSVQRAWGKFGLVDVMMNASGIYFFKFNDEGGCSHVVEQGPLFIRNAPLFAFKWDPSKGLSKPVHSMCPLWVKLHNIPLVAFNVEGIGRIASAIGIPKQMDSATTSMCDRAWGRPGFAKVLIDTWAVGELKREIDVIIPSVNGESDTVAKVQVEYIWEPMQCNHCLVFGHKRSGCTKAVVVDAKKQKQKETDEDGFTLSKPVDARPDTEPIVDELPTMEPIVENAEGDDHTVVIPEENLSLDLNKESQEEVLENDHVEVGETEQPLVEVVEKDRIPDPQGSNEKGPVSNEERAGGWIAGKSFNSGSMSQRTRGTSENVAQSSSKPPVETKVTDNNLGTVCESFFRNWSWVSNVAYCDSGTRIILAWDVRVVDIMVLEVHAQFMHCLVRVKGVADAFYATFVYGSNNTVARRDLWSGLRKAKVIMNLKPWIVLGDFNAMLFQHDGFGGSSRRNVDMEDFFLCMEDVELFDVSYMGIQYTWCQKPQGDEGILRKLDRILCNVEFTSIFTDASARFLPRGISDHAPGLLSFGEAIRKRFMGFVLTTLWLKLLKKPLRQLRARYGDVSKRVVSLKTELDAVQLALDSDPANREIQEDLAHLFLAYHRAKSNEESFYKQRAKVHWLAEGDLNTKFFHKCVKEKRSRSFIHSVYDQNGNFVSGDGVGPTFLTHFEGILGNRDMGVHANIPSGLFRSTLSLSEALNIIRPISDEEIKAALFSIGNDKAPGSDGYTSKFFKSSWDVVGNDVTIAIHNFFYSGRLLKEINHTLICLIPKCPNASRVGDYRPISCCTVLYKCISKIISDRIKPVLDQLVSKSQSAFIPGRRIADNILLAHELVSGYHKQTGPPRCAFKIDIRKAYDTVDWSYVIALLMGFGFHPVLIKWIQEMLQTSSFSLAINGESVGFFKGARGLRQGDPISPYLFTLVMEGFHMAMKHCIQLASDSFGFHAGCQALDISHLCFADDLFVFTSGDVASVDVLKRALDLFRSWSGMEPSLEKSEVFFANVPDDTKMAIINSLPFKAGVFPIRYLGVPLSPTRLKVTDFQPLLDKVISRIHNWKVKALSFAGRKLLISSVLQSLQLYWMSVFILPSGVIHELEALFRKFLWAQGESAQGKCKLSWESVCMPIEKGGLGIRRLGMWNRAMVTKHIWDVLRMRSTLWVQWVRLHYIQGGSFWNMVPKANWSWIFRKMLDLRPLVRRFFFHRLGDGSTTNAWMDKWIPIGPISELIPYRRFSNMGYSISTTARDLILASDGEWPNTWTQICTELQNYQLPTLVDDTVDEICWRNFQGDLGTFSVSDAYTDFLGNLITVDWAMEVWFKGCIPKHAFCVWTACHGRLPTQDRLHWKHDPPDLRCPLCDTVLDTHDHLFFTCDFSLQVWRTIKRDTRLYGFPERWQEICESFVQGRGPKKREQRLALQATIYCIWRERNRRLFGNKSNSADSVIKEIREVVLLRMAWVTFADGGGSN